MLLRHALGTLSPELHCKEHGAFRAPCIGIQVVDEEGDLALANCPQCESTLAWEIQAADEDPPQTIGVCAEVPHGA